MREDDYQLGRVDFYGTEDPNQTGNTASRASISAHVREALQRHRHLAAAVRHRPHHAPARELDGLPARRAAAHPATARPARRSHRLPLRRGRRSARAAWPAGTATSSACGRRSRRATSAASTRRTHAGPHRRRTNQALPARRRLYVHARRRRRVPRRQRAHPALARPARRPARRHVPLRRPQQLRDQERRQPVHRHGGVADRSVVPEPARARRYVEPAQRSATADGAIMPRGTLVVGPFDHFEFDASVGNGVRTVDPSYVAQGLSTPFVTAQSRDLGVSYAGDLGGTVGLRPSRSSSRPTSTRTSSSIPRRAATRSPPAPRARAGPARCARSAPSSTSRPTPPLVKAVFDDTGAARPLRARPRAARRFASSSTICPGSSTTSRCARLLGYGTSYVGQRPLPYGALSDVIYLSDASLGFGWSIFDVRLAGAEPLRRQVPPRRVQLRLELQDRARAHARARAIFTAGAPRTVMLTLSATLGGCVMLRCAGSPPCSARASGCGRRVVQRHDGRQPHHVHRLRARAPPGPREPFTVGGYSIQLTTAQDAHRRRLLRRGAARQPASTAPCASRPDLYAAQVPGPIEVDLLVDQPQEFSVYGTGHARHGAELADVAHRRRRERGQPRAHGRPAGRGHAHADGTAVLVRRDRDHQRQPPRRPRSTPPQPGANPICKQRIVQIGGLDTTFFQGGTLTVTVDPRAWFQLDYRLLELAAGRRADRRASTGDTSVPVGSRRCDFGSARSASPTRTRLGAGAQAVRRAVRRASSGRGVAPRLLAATSPMSPARPRDSRAMTAAGVAAGVAARRGTARACVLGRQRLAATSSYTDASAGLGTPHRADPHRERRGAVAARRPSRGHALQHRRAVPGRSGRGRRSTSPSRASRTRSPATRSRPPTSSHDTYLVDGWEFSIIEYLVVVDKIVALVQPEPSPSEPVRCTARRSPTWTAPFVVDLHKGGKIIGPGRRAEQATPLGVITNQNDNGNAPFDPTARPTASASAPCPATWTTPTTSTSTSDEAADFALHGRRRLQRLLPRASPSWNGAPV